jgi:Holliday junction resolvasome RuvABC endonuclease subunit
MNVLGGDPSLVSFGVATQHGTERLQYKLEKNATFPQLMKRLQWLRDQFSMRVAKEAEPLDDAPHPPLVVLEGYSFGSKGNAIFQTGELGGILRLWMWENNVPLAIVTPQQMKKYATGSGGSGKDLVLSAAVRRFDRDFTNDEADAQWLYAMGCDALGDPIVAVPGINRSILSKIEWPPEVEFS